MSETNVEDRLEAIENELGINQEPELSPAEELAERVGEIVLPANEIEVNDNSVSISYRGDSSLTTSEVENLRENGIQISYVTANVVCVEEAE